MIRRLISSLLCLFVLASPALADPIGTGFTFQGYLEKDAAPYSGAGDFQLRLFDAQTGGAQVGATQSHVGVPVTQGLFTLGLDFGAVFDGNTRWLEVSVQCPGDAGFTTFGGRLEVQGAPYALWAPGGGGGSFVLPFTGSADAPGSPTGIDPSLGTASARFDNVAPGGMSYGITGSTLSNRTYTGGVLGLGLAASGTTSGVVGYAGASPAGRGVTGLGNDFGGYFLTLSTNGHGVGGTAYAGNGVRARSAIGTGVDAASNDGTAVFGESTNGWGMFGVAHAANMHGVFGQAWGANGNGVIGRNESSAGAGVFGYSPAGAVGVLAVADQADGLSARTNAIGKSAVLGYAGAVNAFGGFFTGVVGSTALRVDGRAQVKSLQILGGADLAERFPVREPAEPGTVLVIDDTKEGQLTTSRSAYSTAVAGVVSGANDLDAGIVLSDGEATEGTAAVALSGRVWVKADAREHAIRVGDLLTSSPLAGHCMAAVDATRSHGAVLGKAMSALPAGGTGMVLVLVSLR